MSANRIIRLEVLLLIAAPLFFIHSVDSFARCEKPFRVAFVGDPQINDSTTLLYARRSVYKELRERKDLDMVILLGDLVNDDVSLLLPTKESLDSLPCPWFSVPGNHDRDFYGLKKGRPISIDRRVDEEKSRDFASFRRLIGPEDTSFVEGGIRFILLNDVCQDGRLGYFGGLDKVRKRYVDSVLSATPKDMLAVLSAHIPFSSLRAKYNLYQILLKHPRSLLICGHTHTAGRHEILPGVEEVMVGAACGSFWRGEKDETGISYAVMNCGAPRGYYVADFYKDGEYRLRYKSIAKDDNYMATVWLTDDNMLIANVFGGSETGDVTVRMPGLRGRVSLSRTDMVAPEVLLARRRNVELRKAGGDASDFIPLRKMPSPHIWTGRVAPGRKSKAAARGRKVKVRYRDGSMSFNIKTSVRPLKI